MPAARAKMKGKTSSSAMMMNKKAAVLVLVAAALVGVPGHAYLQRAPSLRARLRPRPPFLQPGLPRQEPTRSTTTSSSTASPDSFDGDGHDDLQELYEEHEPHLVYTGPLCEDGSSMMLAACEIEELGIVLEVGESQVAAGELGLYCRLASGVEQVKTDSIPCANHFTLVSRSGNDYHVNHLTTTTNVATTNMVTTNVVTTGSLKINYLPTYLPTYLA